MLHHVVEKYSELAGHTLFVQGAAEDVNKLQKMVMALSPTVAFMHFSDQRTDCQGSYGHNSHVLREIYAAFTGELCEGAFTANYRGQFAVAAERVRSHQLKVYQQLLRLMERRLPHPDTAIFDVSNPEIGHAIERATSIMFGCYTNVSSVDGIAACYHHPKHKR